MNLQDLEVLNFTLYLRTHGSSRLKVPSIHSKRLFGFHIFYQPLLFWHHTIFCDLSLGLIQTNTKYILLQHIE